MLIRAPREDIDTIEAAIGAVYQSPPQVNIKVRFVEASKDSLAALQNFPSTINPENSQTRILTLTSDQTRSIMKALESSSENDLLAQGQVTTLSARQAQIQSVDTQSIAMKINPAALTSPGIYSSNGTNDLLITTNLPTGPVIDVVPFVSQDADTIKMRLTATVTEFLGYEKGESVTTYVDGKEGKTAVPIPRFRIRQKSGDAIIKDGQTVVLFDNSAKISDSKTPDAKDKNIVVFVTTTLIDSAGNRIHSDAQ
ncbi:MAG TPA: hypothetical protein VFM25_10285 [Verrucomicrobiae bacterium]|nr:hypothetical protein [Verrucomicrobiae bacterium]